MDSRSAAVPAAVRRASSPDAPRARRPRDSRQDAGATRFPRNHHAVTAPATGSLNCTSMFASRTRRRTCVRTSAMAYYLGIDGGGTKTRCVLGDETTVLATAMIGGCSVVRHGEQHAREALHTAIRQVCATARISPDRISAICIGVTGAARPEIAAKIRGIL